MKLSPRVALLSIHPGYAEAILAGSKSVEFRKRGFNAAVETVVIYATSPIQRIVGEFELAEVTNAAPTDLWKAVGSQGAISREKFDAYYNGTAKAFGLVVGKSRRYREPLPLDRLASINTAPQSFCYLDENTLTVIRALADSGTPPTREQPAVKRGWLARLLPLFPG